MERLPAHLSQEFQAALDEHIISPDLAPQINRFLTPFITANELKPQEDRRLPKEYRSLRDYFVMWAVDRNLRAREINSEEYQQTVGLATAQLPYPTFEILCMDGRVLPAIKHGFSAGIGGSIRVPGGTLREFVRNKKTQLLEVAQESNFAKALARIFKKHDTIAQVLDSHIGCAARGKKEQEKRGKSLEDNGLYRDVIEKKQMAQAMINHKHILPIQTSFDPHSGFMYMGLETTEAMDYAKNIAVDKAPTTAKPVYTEDVLRDLTMEGFIISTETLSHHAVIREEFNKHAFAIDWRVDYSGSARNFWRNIALMKEKLMPFVREELVRVYPHLNDEEYQGELEERGMLLLTNAFSGYLHNLSPETGQESHRVYGYGQHEEECVVITEGEYGPHHLSAFEVSSLDPAWLSPNTGLAHGLVQGNRAAGRVVDRSHHFQKPEEYAGTITPTIVIEVVRSKYSADYEGLLARISWSDLPEDWDTMSPEEFSDYLRVKEEEAYLEIPHALVKAIEALRKRMAALYDPGKLISESFVNQDSIALPVIEDQHRKLLGVVPFYKVGY